MYLNCKTYFSQRYGTIPTKQMIELAVEQGITALALTNINCTCDIWDFVDFCRKEKFKPILGVEIRNGDDMLYILLAANNKGLTWINEFLSNHLLADKPFPAIAEEHPFFFPAWVFLHQIKTFTYPNAPALSPRSGQHPPTANYPNNASTFQSYLFHHNKTLQMNNNSLRD